MAEDDHNLLDQPYPTRQAQPGWKENENHDWHRGARECTHLFTVHLNIGDIIFENSWHIEFGELVLAENDEKTCFTARTIAHYDELLAYGGHD